MPDNTYRLADAEDHLDWAYSYEESGELKRALADCEAAIEIGQPFLADAHNLRGIILEEMHRKEEALKAYHKALQIDPSLSEAADNLVALETEMGIRHDLATIGTFSQSAEAHVLKTKLESEGIPAFVGDEHTVTMNWLYSNAIGGVRLQVRESDVEKALEILGLKGEELSLEVDELDDEDEEPHCPNCNSSLINYQKYAKRGLFASWLLLGFPLPFLKKKWICEDCDYEWKM